MGKLDGKVAIVTGAGRGIGAEIARKLAGDGAGAVYLFCISESDYVSAQTLICGGGFFG